MKKRKQASITVFMSLMLMLTASLLFTLLETSRYTVLGMMAVLGSQSVTESIFAEYQIPAYQNYHLLLMDGGYGQGEISLSKINARMQQLGQENLNPTAVGIGAYTNFLQMDVTESSVVRYELATDENCNVLAEQMVEVMKQEIAADLLKKAMDKVTDIQGSDKQGDNVDGYIDDALDTLEQAKEQEESGKENTDVGIQPTGMNTVFSVKKPTPMNTVFSVSQTDNMIQNTAMTVKTALEADSGETQEAEPVEIPENPMEDVKSVQASPLLAQVISGKISAKQLSAEDAVEKRVLNTGNYGEAHTVHAVDKMLLIQYFMKYNSNYITSIKIPHAVQYEQEYLLFGLYSDENNLEKMASRLLLLREGINFAYLMTDSAKREEAFILAASIAAAAGVPMAATAIQMGILASWAYAESIAEVRTLFYGGKVKAIKTGESWSVGLSEIASVLANTSRKSTSVSNGLSYEDYLQTFLYLENTAKLAKRFANLLEKNIRLYSGYEQVKLDCMITALETEMSYKARQIFLTFVTIKNLSGSSYGYQENYTFSYLDKK